ncbi:MAG TPA: hypothetical protein EYN06_10775 [Myxococcales bacterium]|nr:hypothetical protein [Myxococcales bacterium]HIN86957.1 hypothetical protein [Myxococcales bacterium]
MIAFFITALMLTPPDLGAIQECKDQQELAIFTSPRRPHGGASLQILVVSEKAQPGAQIVVMEPDGSSRVVAAIERGGPPFGWWAQVKAPREGVWRSALVRDGKVLACQKVKVHRRKIQVGKLRPDDSPVWKASWKWEWDTENLYSFWIEQLFHAPREAEPSWRPLHEVLRDPKRNFLFNHKNLNEDNPKGMRVKPDCADFPYFLRAYFAWKLRLPFSYRSCSRGSSKRAPRCGAQHTHEIPAVKESVVKSFEHFLRREVARRVHSSTGRVAPTDENSDYYPVALTRRALRPGAVFHDPYGHVLVVSAWFPQENGGPGVLFAVDAQPDTTIGRRRFWRGSFLFPEDSATPGAGFKRFRPIVRRRKEWVLLSNKEINSRRDYGDFSTEQWSRGKASFYSKMEALIHPQPLSPKMALSAVLDALTEQVRRRVLSVDTGEEWRRKNSRRVIEIPDGSSIFQTSGPWEDYSTPSRDLRLLIAIQSVIDLPKRILAHPERYQIPEGGSGRELSQQVALLIRAEAAKRGFDYTRSDGSKHSLSVGDVIDRREALEMAYNPNDCPEIRWGAPKGSQEFSTCRRRATSWQRKKMNKYRVWFRERRRPLH